MRLLSWLVLGAVAASGCMDPVCPRSRPLVALVFDDNPAGVFEHAYPLMTGSGIVGTVFVHTCSIGQPGYMSLHQLQTLHRAGWEIGAHTMTHADLTRLPADQVVVEAAGSKALLEASGFPCGSFAIPYGLANAEVREVLNDVFQIVRDSQDRCLRVPIDWQLVGMYALHEGEDPASAMGRLDRAVRRSEDLVVLGFHGVARDGDGAQGSYPCYEAGDLETILRHIARLSLPCATLSDARRLLR